MSRLVIRHDPVMLNIMSLEVMTPNAAGNSYRKVSRLSSDQARDLVASNTGISFVGPMPLGTRHVDPARLHISPRLDAKPGQPLWQIELMRFSGNEKLSEIDDLQLASLMESSARLSFPEGEPDLTRHSDQIAALDARRKLIEDEVPGYEADPDPEPEMSM